MYSKHGDPISLLAAALRSGARSDIGSPSLLIHNLSFPMPYFDMAIYGADWALLFLRIAVAATFLSHGLQKWGMWKTAPSEQMNASQLSLMRALSLVEPVAALSVLLGLFTLYGALAIAVVMTGAIYFKIAVWKKKFAETGGWEFDLVLFAVTLLIAALGPGVFSLTLP